jgi:hypothetical protein
VNDDAAAADRQRVGRVYVVGSTESVVVNHCATLGDLDSELVDAPPPCASPS